ncbi:unnamed protein product [Lathyrus sativus]|nr:unnamed protein product [Lathyrus sativus]
MKSTPRMRRYVSGLRKLIRINQGPKMLLRPSSKVFGSSDGFEGDTGDAFDAHQWKCVRIMSGTFLLPYTHIWLEIGWKIVQRKIC